MPPLSASDRVDTPSLSYTRQADKWRKIDDLCLGTEGMRLASTLWLPREEKERHGDYTSRLGRSILYPALSETIDTGASRMFSKPVTLQSSDLLDERLQKIEYEADKGGNRSLTEFGRIEANDGMRYGRFHVLVDFPATTDSVNLGVEQKTGVRPYFARVSPNDLIGWKFRPFPTSVDPTPQEQADRDRHPGAKPILSLLRVRETIVVEDGQFGEKEIHTIRVLRDEPKGATWEVWTEPDKRGGDWQLDSSGDITLGRIPLVSAYYAYIAPFESSPPYEGLAWQNIAHWQSYSEQRNLLRVARVPILTAVGVKKEELDAGITIGSNKFLGSTNPDAKFSFTEHTGAAIDSGRMDLKDIEERMEVLGNAPLTSRSGAVTATAKAIDESKSASDLEAWARVTEQALFQCYEIAAEWIGETLPEEFSIDIASDIGLSLRPADDMTTLLAMKNAGTLTAETVNQEAKRRGILGEMVDPEEEAQKARDNPPMGMLSFGGFGQRAPAEDEETDSSSTAKGATGTGAGEAA